VTVSTNDTRERGVTCTCHMALWGVGGGKPVLPNDTWAMGRGAKASLKSVTYYILFEWPLYVN